MNRSKKKSFDWYGARQRFSIRKYHIGAASVLLGTTLVLGTGAIVGAETGVNGGTSNGQIVPGNGTGTSEGTTSTTQQQSDNQGNNSSGVQTGNTTNSTANVQSAGDTSSASGQPVGTSRSADTGTQGGGSTNQPVDEPIMIIPSSASETAPPGYVTVSFNGHDFTKGFTLGTQTGTSSVKVFVKNTVTWGELLDDPAWKWPTVETKYSGDTVVGWSFNKNYKPGVAFVFDTMKDQVVSNTSLYPNVVYEVEDVNGDGTKKGYLAQYGPDEQDKWIFITFDAGQGQLKRSKKSKMVAVSNNLKTIDFSNSLFTKKVESPTLQGHTFVRWQTQDGKVLPKSGTITTETTYEALYLAHPENQVAVFDSKKLTDSEKEQVKKNILDANPNLSTGVPQVIKAIDISATGEATVTFDDGTVVKVSSTTLTNEDKDTAKSNAKAEIEKEATEKSDAINASNLTEEEKRARLTEVRDVQDRADIAIDNAATTEDLTKAISDGTAAIEAVSTTSTIKTKAKEALEEAYNTKKDEIDNSSLTAEEKSAKQEELDQAKSAADSAIDTATDDAGVGTALNKGKADIEAIGTIISDKKIAARQQLEDAYSAKETEITNSNLTLEEKATKLAELDKAKEVAENAIDTATDNAGVDTALTNGQSAISGIDTSSSAKKAQAKQDLETAYNAKKDEIAKSALTAEEKAVKQAELDKAKEDAENAIVTATDNAGVDTALTNGQSAISGIDTSTSAKKDQAKEELKAAADDAKKAIEANDNLTDAEKQAAKKAVDDEVAKANDAIDAATKADEVDAATLAGEKAVAEDVLDAAKQDAKNKIAKDVEAANAAIESNPNLSEDEKQTFKDAVDEAAQTAKGEIDKAKTPAEAQTAEEAGTAAIAEDVLDAAKQDAKNKIAKDLATVEAAIDANSNLSQDEKDAAKLAAQAKEAEAVANIEKATTPEAAQTLEDAAVKDLANIEIKAAYDDAV
ncbi:DUF1542 domain-containing protein, partial [Streptococcus suis]|nr:DUF1542 domain-containing protein [Streptococcus suis]